MCAGLIAGGRSGGWLKTRLDLPGRVCFNPRAFSPLMAFTTIPSPAGGRSSIGESTFSISENADSPSLHGTRDGRS